MVRAARPGHTTNTPLIIGTFKWLRELLVNSVLAVGAKMYAVIGTRTKR